MTTDLLDITGALLRKCKDADYRGYDPFDSLNSQILASSFLKSNRMFRLLFLQLGKRSPINFRKLLGVPMLRNPKGIALFISGLIEDYLRTKDPSYLEEATALAEWLIAQQSDRNLWRHSCWGYPFDWQARAFFVPKGTPNIISTYYCANALHSLGKICDNQQYIETALDSVRFMRKHLLTQNNGETFYAYIPGEKILVHNASLWGAAWSVFAGSLLDETTLVEQGLEVARNSISHQQKDGSWLYGTEYHHNFVDSFHTGYNLEALQKITSSIHTTEFENSISSGFQYYRNTFITSQGLVSYFADRQYPLDMHCFAQAIITLIAIGGPETLPLCNQVAFAAISKLYLKEEERFAYQKSRLVFNKLNYIRWTQAWTYYSFAQLNRHNMNNDGTN